MAATAKGAKVKENREGRHYRAKAIPKPIPQIEITAPIPTKRTVLPGRPHSLVADQQTLRIIAALARIQCTGDEISCALGVSINTWDAFKRDNPVVGEVMRNWRGEGRISLRRNQFKAADNLNPALLIWLGKQELGQRDKFEHTGPGGGPIQVTVDVSGYSDDKLELLEEALIALPPPAGGGAAGGDTGGEAEADNGEAGGGLGGGD